MKKTKFLVLGTNGMAGHTIALYLKENGYIVDCFAKSNGIFKDTIIGDAKDTKFLENTIHTNNYDYVINCIGILNESAENDKENSVFINSYLPHFLSKITSGINTKIIQISTDCVFSGLRGQYKENDFKDGRSFYDKTKSLGEIDDDKNITIRSSIIGPDLNQNGIGLFNWFMKQNNEIIGYKKAVWTGQTTLQLAKTIVEITKSDFNGLYNLVPQHSISKYDLLLIMNSLFKDNRILISPDEQIVIDKSLIRTKFDFEYVIPDYYYMLEEMKNWIIEHKHLYSHYSFS